MTTPHQPQPHTDGISRELLGKIIDDVFDGAIEDASVIEEIYACIKRHEPKIDIDIASQRLTEAMEGELDGLTTDVGTARKIMAYVFTGEPA